MAVRLAVLLLVGLLLLGTGSGTQAATYYVATNGNNANSCSAATNINTPKQSPANGAGCLGAGDTLYIRAGTYNVGTSLNNPPSGNSNSQRVTIAGYPPDGSLAVRLNFPNSLSEGEGIGLVISEGTQYVTFDNLIFDCAGNERQCIKYQPESGDGVNFQNSEVRNGNLSGILVNGGFGHLLKNLNIHNNGTVDKLDHGIYVGVTDGLTIEDCNIHHNPVGFGIQVFNGTTGRVNATVIRRNRIHHNRWGTVVGSGNNHLYYNNYVYLNDAMGVENKNGGSNNRMYNNSVYGNGGDCFYNDNNGSVFGNNICYGNSSNTIRQGTSAETFSNLLGTNPLWVNPDAGDLRLTANSTNAIDRGTSLSSFFTNDLEGTTRPQGSAWDIGADEFGGAGTPTCPSGCTCTATPGVCDPAPSCPSGCTCTLTPGVCDPPPDPGEQAEPVVWWKFDEGTGSTANNEGGGHTGTLQNGATWTTGRVGSFALQLDGVNDVVSVGDLVLSDAKMANWRTKHSVCLWAQTTNPAALGSGSIKQTLLNFALDGNNGIRLVLNEALTPQGLWWVTIMAEGTAQAAGTQAQVFQANQWVHLCYTLGSATLTLYANGTLQSQRTDDRFDPAGGVAVIGARTTADGNWSGKIDNVKLWNRMLSASEVQAEYGGAPSATRGPLHRVLTR